MVVHSGRRAEGRRLEGRVLDLGGSDSHRTMHHRPSVEHCVVLDGPDDPALFALARTDERFDHVLAVCAFSRAEDVEATLAAVSTLLAPGGRLHFVEPVSTSSRVRSASRLARPVVNAASAFHLDRNVVQEIRNAGFTICDIHRDRSTALWWPVQHVARGSARHTISARPREGSRRR